MTPATTSPRVPVLLVEDDPADVETTVRAFRKANVSGPIVRCEDGDEALAYLAVTPTLPSLILLDLNLPGTDGREVLAEIKKCPRLRKIPVLVLTTSKDEEDILACYEVGASSFVQKPVDCEAFMDFVRRFKEFWLELVVLPNTEEPVS